MNPLSGSQSRRRFLKSSAGVAAAAALPAWMIDEVRSAQPSQSTRSPNEQLGIILKGRLTFTIGGETRELGPGDTYEIPANVPHEAKAGPEGAVAIDVFSPVRADWDRFVPIAPCPPFWP